MTPPCTADPDGWTGSKLTPADKRRAARLCADCPLRGDCLGDALGQHHAATGDDWRPHGIWGGVWFDYRGRAPRPIPLPDHGTRLRYDEGCHCRPCQIARGGPGSRVAQRGAA